MDMVKIGKFLKELRNEKGFTQETLGEKVGVTNKTVSRWETGTYMPPVECLVLLSDIYGVSINEIVAGQRLSETEFTNAAEENLSEALLSENIYKQREKKLMLVMLISTVIAIILIFLIPISKDNMIRSMITVLLIIGLAVISNALNLVALAQNKERCEKKE